MTNPVQVAYRRDTAANIAVSTGVQGELWVDTINNRLVVNDGGTPGGWAAVKMAEVGLLKAAARAVNIDATGDTAVAISLPAGVTNYRIERIIVLNSTGALPSTAELGVYTAASEGGATIAAQQALSGITSQSPNVNDNALSLTLTNNNTTVFNSATLYIHVGTAQGAAATADVIILLQPL